MELLFYIALGVAMYYLLDRLNMSDFKHNKRKISEITSLQFRLDNEGKEIPCIIYTKKGLKFEGKATFHRKDSKDYPTFEFVPSSSYKDIYENYLKYLYVNNPFKYCELIDV